MIDERKLIAETRHVMNNALNLITNNAIFIADGVCDDAKADALEIKTASESLLQWTRDVIRVVSACRQPLQVSSLRLEDVVDMINDNQVITFEPGASSLPYILANGDDLCAIMRVLSTHVQRFSQSGRVQVMAHAESDGKLRIYIGESTDVPGEEAELPSDHTRDDLGLGLLLAKCLLERANSTLQVLASDTRYGFTFTLPIDSED